MDLSKLSLGDKVLAGSSFVLFIAYFLPWFKVEVEGLSIGDAGTATGSDLGFLWSTLPMLLALVTLIVLGIRLFAPQVQLPDLPWGQIFLGVGIWCAFWVVLKLLIGEDGNDFIDVSRSWGLFLAALAAIGMAVGGYFKFKESGGETPSIGGSPGSGDKPATPF